MGVPPVGEYAVQMRASVTYRVISSAGCPVLIVRDEIKNDSASRGRGPTPESPGIQIRGPPRMSDGDHSRP
jgi:hypothetical protein